MAGKRQPVDLLLAKGKKHLTKAEIELRRAKEVNADADEVAPPKWLDRSLRARFNSLAAKLIEIGIMSNLDCDALARLVVCEQQFVDLANEIAAQPILKEIQRPKLLKNGSASKTQMENVKVVNEIRERLLIQQDRAYKQCRQGAMDFGLTISARCRLVAPESKDDGPENKFLKYKKDVTAAAGPSEA